MRALCCGRAPAVKDGPAPGHSPAASCSGVNGKVEGTVEAGHGVGRTGVPAQAPHAAPVAAGRHSHLSGEHLGVLGLLEEAPGQQMGTAVLRKAAGWQHARLADPAPGLGIGFACQRVRPVTAHEADGAETLARVSSASSSCRSHAPPQLARTFSVESYKSARSTPAPESPTSPQFADPGPFGRANADAGLLSPRILARHDLLHASSEPAAANARRPGSSDAPRTPRAHGTHKPGGGASDAGDGEVQLGRRACGVAGALLDRTPLQERRHAAPAGCAPAPVLEGADSLEESLGGRTSGNAALAPTRTSHDAASASHGVRAHRAYGGSGGDAPGTRPALPPAVRTVDPRDAPGEPVGWVRAGSLGAISRMSQVGPWHGPGVGLLVIPAEGYRFSVCLRRAIQPRSTVDCDEQDRGRLHAPGLRMHRWCRP